MKGLEIALLGGRDGGDATAADLIRARHRVRLWRRSAMDFDAVLKTGRMT
jgi:hypothetical protein